jgi:peptide/nickel transport system ATP-binding protein
MYAGEIVETGSVEAVFRSPNHPYTRGLIDAIPVPGKTLPGSRLGSIRGSVPSLVGDVTGCVFRDRCPYAMPICELDPPLRHDADHRWLCVLEEAA